ncbi:unnamed protein product, partial [Owenia fusiformis]
MTNITLPNSLSPIAHLPGENSPFNLVDTSFISTPGGGVIQKKTNAIPDEQYAKIPIIIYAISILESVICGTKVADNSVVTFEFSVAFRVAFEFSVAFRVAFEFSVVSGDKNGAATMGANDAPIPYEKCKEYTAGAAFSFHS